MLTNAAPMGGTVVSLSSNNAAVAVPAIAVTVPAGSTGVDVHNHDNGRCHYREGVTIDANYNGVDKTATLTTMIAATLGESR